MKNKKKLTYIEYADKIFNNYKRVMGRCFTEQNEKENEEFEEACGIYHKAQKFQILAMALFLIDNTESTDRLSKCLEICEDDPMWEWFADWGIHNDETLNEAYDIAIKTLRFKATKFRNLNMEQIKFLDEVDCADKYDD